MKNKKVKTKSFRITNIVYVLGAGLIVRILLSFFGTLHLDQNTFIAWSNILVGSGLHNFYNSWSDYLPGYLYVLWLLGKINAFVPQVLLYKLPAILSDLATGFVIYKILSKLKNEKWGLIGAAIYIFNPAVFANSTLWGQVDSLTALTAMLSLYLLPISYPLSSVFLSLGTLVKPQTAFAFPIILFLFIKNKKQLSDLFFYCLIGLSIFVLAFVPFWNFGNLATFIYTRLGLSFSQYPYTSINAFNFWGLIGFWQKDNMYMQLGGYLFVLLTTTILAFKNQKKKLLPYYLLSYVFAASFMFFTRIHERHLLPVFAPLAVVAVDNPVFLIPYLGFSLSYVANLYYSFEWITYDFVKVFPDLFLKLFSFINVGLAIFMFYAVVRKLTLSWNSLSVSIRRYMEMRKKRQITVKVPKIKISARRVKQILFIILAFSFAARVFNLGSPPNEYFDEVYHAFTAKVILHGDPKAWEWWNTPPKGFAYEWTHPPIAKLGMVLGMLTFGENSFGWRIPGALLGVGVVYLVYLIAKELLNDEVTSLLSAAVFSLDGLALVMSRIGMNDTYILFFALLSLYLFIKKKDFFAALAFGFALASKWSAVWTIPIIGILWLWRKKKFTTSIIWFFVLPIAVYLLSYFDMFLTGHTLTTWWGMQEQMWWYHTGLRATHPYSSMWWSWPFMVRPIYLYTSEEIGGMVARIYAMGNPLVFWFGFASVVSCLLYSYLEKNRKIGLIVFSYFMFFVPWALSPRIMFLYHYLPSLPFLAIATGYVLRRNLKLITPFFVLAVILFIYFYPHWAGLKIPLWLDQSYYWVSSWR